MAHETSSEREQDLLARLRAVGSPVVDLWHDFPLTPEVVEVVADWLRETDDGTFDIDRLGAANRLVTTPSVARRHWETLVRLYRDESEGRVREPLGAAVARAVTRETLPEYTGLLEDASLGTSRVMLVRGLRRLRGPERDAALARLREDPLFHPVLGIRS